MSHPTRLTERRAQYLHEDVAFNTILEENAKLQEDLSLMVSFKRHTQTNSAANSEVSGSRVKKAGRETEELQSQQSRRDTALTFGDNQPTRAGFHSGSQLQGSSPEESTHTNKISERERIADLDDKLRETVDALEYMKKRERALQEEVKMLTQVVAKKDNSMQTLESKNRILLASKIEVESKMADVLDQADEVLMKYDRLREINSILQQKLASLETEVATRSQFDLDQKKQKRDSAQNTPKDQKERSPNQPNSHQSSSRSKGGEVKAQEQHHQPKYTHQEEQEDEEDHQEEEGGQEEYEEEQHEHSQGQDYED